MLRLLAERVYETLIYMRRFSQFLVLIFLLFAELHTAVAAEPGANPEREFIMSCTYGVLAGTLVGAASLAFVDKPGDNLQRVARGASLGLYIGIGLGFYTVYILPKQLQKEDEKILEGETSQSNNGPNWFVFPIVGDKGVDGAGAFIQLARF